MLFMRQDIDEECLSYPRIERVVVAHMLAYSSGHSKKLWLGKQTHLIPYIFMQDHYDKTL